MDTVTKFLPTVLGVLSSIIGAAASGPVGAIASGVAIIGVIALGVWLRNLYVAYLVKKAQDTETQNASTDATGVVAGNQGQATGDAATIGTTQSDKDKAKAGGS